MSKQSKQYESMRQTQTNTFSDGLNMDLHPLTTPNTILTDCVNGTMITYNDNEFVLQNERGNSKIKIGDSDKYVTLSEGFIPVGMKEYNGILYIVSHNPQTKESEIGTYPSPNKIQEHGVTIKFNGDDEYKANYNSFDQNIIYYDYNVIVTNQDNYTFNSSHNPLLVLEHFILNKTGEVTKTKLIPTESEKTYRFTHEGEGILGYRYRPYYLSSITPSIIHSKGGSDAQLVIEATSDDKELYEVLKIQDDIKFKYDIIIEFVNGKNKLEFKSESLDIDKWDYTFNLTNVSKLPLQFENNFTIENEDGEITCEYNYRTGELITTKTINDNPVETIYKEVNFNITPRIYTSNDNYIDIVYDNLITDYKTTMDVVFKQESWFTTFKYKPQNDDSNKLSILATLDLSRFDIDWATNVQTINEASYKLYEIDKYGNIKGKSVFTPKLNWVPTYKVVADASSMGKYDLTVSESKEYQFTLGNISELQPVQYSNIELSQCTTLSETTQATYVQYIKKDDKTYNVVLLDKNYNVLSTTNVWSDTGCSNMIDERWDGINPTVDYIINDVEIEENKIYLLELTFPINEEINKASFIIVTAQSMFDKYSEDILNQRMDEILLKEWFEPNVHIEYNTLHNDYRNASSFVNNLIDIERIKSMPTDDNGETAKKYAMQFFLKYNQLFTNPNNNEIPAIGEQFDCTAFIKNKSDFDCVIEYNGSISINERSIEKNIINALSLVADKQEIIQQTSERKYLYDIFNVVNDVVIKCDGAYSKGVGGALSASPSDTAISINTYKMGSSNMFSLGWTNWLDDGHMEIENKYNYTQVTKDNCKVTKQGSNVQYYTWNTSNTYTELFGGPVQILYKSGLNGGLNYSNIKDENNVNYSGQNKKIFIHSKHHDKKSYMLLGIDGLNDSEENSKLACNVLLKHGYYTIPCNRQIYQYVFKTVDEKISINNIKTEDAQTPIKIYPGQCMAIYNDYSSYNIQNWNNLHILNLIPNYNIEEFKISYTSPDGFNVNYKYFLETLGTLINNHCLDPSVLNEQINNTIIKFDNSENLFIDNVSKINNGADRNYNNSFRDMNMPELMYDKDNNLIYYILKSNVIDQFEYSGGDCVRPLKWNYSIPFDTNDGFWPDGSLDNIEKLNDYHSLLFYKLTAYNGEPS